MFVHTVFFWLKEQDSDQARQALHKGLKALATIAEIQTAYVGTPATTRRPVIDHSYDFSITFIFPDKAAQDVYQDHPDHHTFIAECSHLWDRVQIYDAVS